MIKYLIPFIALCTLPAVLIHAHGLMQGIFITIPLVLFNLYSFKTLVTLQKELDDIKKEN